MSTTALVLAGGRSRRFGSAKLAAPLEGRPLLEHVLLMATEICPRTLVAVPSGEPPTILSPGLGDKIEVVADERPFEGPLAAATGAAGHVSGGRLLLLAGDMPWLVPDVLRLLLGFAPDRDGACLVLEGVPSPLPLGLDRDALVSHGTALIAAGERSLRSLLERADLEQIPASAWRRFDAEGRSLRDVDRPQDL